MTVFGIGVVCSFQVRWEYKLAMLWVNGGWFVRQRHGQFCLLGLYEGILREHERSQNKGLLSLLTVLGKYRITRKNVFGCGLPRWLYHILRGLHITDSSVPTWTRLCLLLLRPSHTVTALLSVHRTFPTDSVTVTVCASLYFLVSQTTVLIVVPTSRYQSQSLTHYVHNTLRSLALSLSIYRWRRTLRLLTRL